MCPLHWVMGEGSLTLLHPNMFPQTELIKVKTKAILCLKFFNGFPLLPVTLTEEALPGLTQVPSPPPHLSFPQSFLSVPLPGPFFPAQQSWCHLVPQASVCFSCKLRDTQPETGRATRMHCGPAAALPTQVGKTLLFLVIVLGF